MSRSVISSRSHCIPWIHTIVMGLVCNRDAALSSPLEDSSCESRSSVQPEHSLLTAKLPFELSGPAVFHKLQECLQNQVVRSSFRRLEIAE